jgi:hypothetical protein
VSNLWDLVHRHPAPVSLQGVEAFDVSDIAREFWESRADDFPYAWEQLPNVAPPFARYFMFAAPKVYRAAGKEIHIRPGGSMGVLFDAVKLDDGWRVSAGCVGGGETGIRWQPFMIQYLVRSDGGLGRFDQGQFRVLGDFSDIEHMRRMGWTSQNVISALTGLIYPFVLATSILHCKNVSAKRIDVPRSLALACERRGRPRYSYSVLDINPMRAVLRTEGGMGDGGNSFVKALHLCRGHFKDYRDGNGLFGRFKGVYWWDATARGNVSAGVRIKDYRVMAS